MKAPILFAILSSILGPVLVASETELVQVSPAEETPRLVVLDRSGKIVHSVTEPGTYSQPVFSSDHKRLAVVKADPRTQNPDIWVIDLATGRTTQLTSGAPNATPVWSPDDSEIAYVSIRLGVPSIYRRSSSSAGDEHLLYRHNGFGGVVLTEWRAGGLLRFVDAINISGAFYELALDGAGKAS